ncbi:hypothetical protein AB0V79_23895 [Mesorhizobium ciceri]|nr:hypothetical protein [Mesorhizobium ciceri]
MASEARMSKGAISTMAAGREVVHVGFFGRGMIEHPLKWLHLAAICRSH